MKSTSDLFSAGSGTGKRKRSKNYFLLMLFLLPLLSFFFSGCGTSSKTEISKGNESPERLQIGLSFDSFVIERWIRDRDMFVSTANALGADVNVQVAGGNIEEQIAQLEYFIQKKMDVIVVIAIDGDAVANVLRRAKEAGIKVVCYDRVVKDFNADVYISFDNEKVGILMAEAMINALPEGGTICGIFGSPTDENVTQIVKGFTETIEGTNLTLAYTSYCENWLAELAYGYAHEAAQLYPDMVGLMCGNDDLAGQALRALSEKRMAGNVIVTAQDADLAACQRLVENTQEMTVYKPVEQEASAAAKLAVLLAKGVDITDPNSEMPVTEIFEAGENSIPYYRLEPIAVTSDNLEDTIIADGFHTSEEIYLNVK